MNKIVALACAASALALASAAQAQSTGSSTGTSTGSGIGSTGDQFSVTIQGTVPGYCTLSAPLTLNVSNGSFNSNGTRSGTFQIKTLGSADGIVQTVTATGSFSISANESCKLSLTSANGGLNNQSNSSAKKIGYSAGVWESTSSGGAPVQVPGANTTFSEITSSFDPDKLGNDTINFGFSITQGSSAVAAGNYQDVLTLNVTPTI